MARRGSARCRPGRLAEIEQHDRFAESFGQVLDRIVDPRPGLALFERVGGIVLDLLLSTARHHVASPLSP
ncbi:MAG TPA: hypothetical protein VEL07_02370 [Planctomycetota bacterium]|nr:hypothetical protein [Planctomycetota bacterium]